GQQPTAGALYREPAARTDSEQHDGEQQPRDDHGVQLTQRPSGDYRRRRSPRMESRNDEKKIWMPTMISVAASTARRSSASRPNPRVIQSIRITVPSTRPPSRVPPPSSSPCSSLNLARMRSNQRSV